MAACFTTTVTTTTAATTTTTKMQPAGRGAFCCEGFGGQWVIVTPTKNGSFSFSVQNDIF